MAAKRKETIGRDEKRRTADSSLIFKPSASPATEQLIGQFVPDDRSLTDQGASLFIFISLPNITFVWPLDEKNDFLSCTQIFAPPFQNQCSQQDLDF